MIKNAGYLWILFALVLISPGECPESFRAKNVSVGRSLSGPAACSLPDWRETDGNAVGLRYKACCGPDTASSGNVFFSKEEWRILSNSMGVAYRKPTGFDEVSRTECFEEYPELKRIVSCAWNWLRSDDGQCVVCLPVYPPFTEKDTLFILHNRRLSPDDPLRMLDRQHVGQTYCHIVFAQGYDPNYFLQRKRKRKIGNWRDIYIIIRRTKLGVCSARIPHTDIH